MLILQHKVKTNMSDVLLQQVAPESLAPNETDSRRETSQLVEDVEQLGVEIEDKEGVGRALDVLRTEFCINDRVFDNVKSKLVLTAIASRLNQLEAKTEQSVVSKTLELEYIADLVMVCVGTETAFADQHKQALEIHGVSDEQTLAAYDKFTQPEVTRDMAEFIHGPAFDELRQRLGIADEEEFQVRVLSVDDGYVSHGMAPETDWDTGAYEEVVKDDRVKKAYLQGLRDNSDKLSLMLGREGSFAPAWVTTLDSGRKILCLALPTAEKVLYRKEARSRYYSEEDYEHDLALVKHEYTHTQKMLLFDGSVGLGIALEELRAEHFSGDKHGYTDIKKYFMGMRMITGYSPKDSFELNGAAYDEERFLADIAKNVGLDGFLDVMTVIPGNYAKDEHASSYLKGIVSHNGDSLSKQFRNLYNKYYDADPQAVESRLNESIDRLRDMVKDKTISVEDWLHYGGITSLGDIGTENFRRRYPEESVKSDGSS